MLLFLSDNSTSQAFPNPYKNSFVSLIKKANIKPQKWLNFEAITGAVATGQLFKKQKKYDIQLMTYNQASKAPDIANGIFMALSLQMAMDTE